MTDSFFQALVRELEAALDDDDVEFASGDAELSRHGNKLERVVWVWRGGRLAPTTRQRARAGSEVVHPVYDDRAVVEAHLRAGSDAALERLWTRILTLARRALGTASVPGDYVFRGSQSSAVSGRTDAREMMQRFEWRLSVREQDVPGGATVAALGFDTTFAISPHE